MTVELCKIVHSAKLNIVIPFFADRVYYHVVAIFSTSDICLHRRTAPNVGI